MTFLSQKQFQFTYFAQQLGTFDWRGKYVLDFGGNIGNMLRDDNATIDHERYHCLDVDARAIEVGRREFPAAHFQHYDRHCFFFNPEGVPGLALPPIDQRFDHIVAYSVFTNTPLGDMHDLVDQLLLMLAPGGVLAFTFIDPHHHSWPGRYAGGNLAWRLEKSQREGCDIDVDALLAQARGTSWCTLVNGRDLHIESDDFPSVAAREQKSCHLFYTAAFIRAQYPQATILPPANDEMQHCCIIARREPEDPPVQPSGT